MSKAKDENKRLNRIIVIMLALIAVVVICTTFFILKTPQAGLFSQPEQRAPVEVVEKISIDAPVQVVNTGIHRLSFPIAFRSDSLTGR